MFILSSATDTLIPNLTVEAQLLYAADLSSPRGVPPAGKAERVRDVVQLLRLDAVAHRAIGCAWTPRISGGAQALSCKMLWHSRLALAPHRVSTVCWLLQACPSAAEVEGHCKVLQLNALLRMAAAGDMRRVSIGIALVSQPGALVVDNPAGGLSHSAGNRIIHTLKVQACSNVCPLQWFVSTVVGHGPPISLLGDHLQLPQVHCTHQVFVLLLTGCGAAQPDGGGGPGRADAVGVRAAGQGGCAAPGPPHLPRQPW